MRTSTIYTYLLAGVLSASLHSCNEAEFLTEYNPNSPVEAAFWKDEADAKAALATVYNPIRGAMYGYFGAYEGFQNLITRADDVFATPNDDGESWAITIFNNTPNTGRNNWSDLYKGIQRANVFLYNLDKVSMDENVKKEMQGEAYFLRGYQYFLLAINYGQAIIHTTPTGLVSGDGMKGLSSEAEVWAQVESDLQKAKELLPISRPASENGRITKGAAIAHLGKAYIFQKKYAEGAAELKIIMSAPYTYDLVETFEDNFKSSTEFNKESIFELNYAKFGSDGGEWTNGEDANSMMGNVLANFFGPQGDAGGWFKVQVSSYLVDEFTIEKRPANSDSKWDKRMYTTFFFKYSDYNDVKPDETWYDNVKFDKMWNDCTKRTEKGQPTFNDIDGIPGRFLFKKLASWWCKNGATMYSNWDAKINNYRVMRFAEVLLLHAEACAQTGDFASANADLKRIRERAGLPDKTFNGKDELMKEMEHQKLLEFPMEGLRFFDLKRWYSYDQLKALFIEHDKQGAENFMPKHFWLPIPQNEVNANVAIQQLPAWQ